MQNVEVDRSAMKAGSSKAKAERLLGYSNADRLNQQLKRPAVPTDKAK